MSSPLGKGYPLSSSSAYTQHLSEEIECENKKTIKLHQVILGSSFLISSVIAYSLKRHIVSARCFLLGSAFTTLSSSFVSICFGQKRSIDVIGQEIKNNRVILPKE